MPCSYVNAIDALDQVLEVLSWPQKDEQCPKCQVHVEFLQRDFLDKGPRTKEQKVNYESQPIG